MYPSLRFTALSILTSLVLLSPSHADNPIASSFPYGSEKVRGVNLGGWLVLEPWITPSIFDNTGNSAIVDEWTFCGLQSRSTAMNVLENHWSTFYTESDFAYIQEAGLNHVRIPIGYWAFQIESYEPFCQGQVPYLQQAIQWARTYNIKVLIDLHGAPASQNGYDNSGQRLSYPQWQDNSTNIGRTTAIIQQIASMFESDSDVVVAIEALNEPAGYDSPVLSVLDQFYYNSYGIVRYPSGSTQSNTLLVLHDAFQSGSYWNGFMQAPSWQGVMLDTHIYQVFSDPDVAMTQAQHISAACNTANGLSSSGLWTMVGEWSTASTDCATYINGRGVGSRYDGTYPGSPYVGSCTGLSGSASSFSSQYKQFLRQYYEAQVSAYESGGQGWIFWTWKTQAGTGEEWSYFVLLQEGVFPWDPTDREYPNIC